MSVKAHQSPERSCTSGKNISFQDVGLFLIVPEACMKSVSLMSFLGARSKMNSGFGKLLLGLLHAFLPACVSGVYFGGPAAVGVDQVCRFLEGVNHGLECLGILRAELGRSTKLKEMMPAHP